MIGVVVDKVKCNFFLIHEELEIDLKPGINLSVGEHKRQAIDAIRYIFDPIFNRNLELQSVLTKCPVVNDEYMIEEGNFKKDCQCKRKGYVVAYGSKNGVPFSALRYLTKQKFNIVFINDQEKLSLVDWFGILYDDCCPKILVISQNNKGIHCDSENNFDIDELMTFISEDMLNEKQELYKLYNENKYVGRQIEDVSTKMLKTVTKKGESFLNTQENLIEIISKLVSHDLCYSKSYKIWLLSKKASMDNDLLLAEMYSKLVDEEYTDYLIDALDFHHNSENFLIMLQRIRLANEKFKSFSKHCSEVSNTCDESYELVSIYECNKLLNDYRINEISRRTTKNREMLKQLDDQIDSLKLSILRVKDLIDKTQIELDVSHTVRLEMDLERLKSVPNNGPLHPQFDLFEKMSTINTYEYLMTNISQLYNIDQCIVNGIEYLNRFDCLFVFNLIQFKTPIEDDLLEKFNRFLKPVLHFAIVSSSQVQKILDKNNGYKSEKMLIDLVVPENLYSSSKRSCPNDIIEMLDGLIVHSDNMQTLQILMCLIYDEKCWVIESEDAYIMDIQSCVESMKTFRKMSRIKNKLIDKPCIGTDVNDGYEAFYQIRNDIHDWKTNVRQTLPAVERHFELQKELSRLEISLKYKMLITSNIRKKNTATLPNTRPFKKDSQYEERTWNIIQKRLEIDSILDKINFDFECLSQSDMVVKSKDVIINYKRTAKKLAVLHAKVEDSKKLRTEINNHLKVTKPELDSVRNAYKHFDTEKEMIMQSYNVHFEKFEELLKPIPKQLNEFERSMNMLFRCVRNLTEIDANSTSFSLNLFAMERKLFKYYDRFLMRAERFFNAVDNDIHFKCGFVRNGELLPLTLHEHDTFDMDLLDVSSLDRIHLQIWDLYYNKESNDAVMMNLLRFIMKLTRLISIGCPLITIEIDNAEIFNRHPVIWNTWNSLKLLDGIQVIAVTPREVLDYTDASINII